MDIAQKINDLVSIMKELNEAWYTTSGFIHSIKPADFQKLWYISKWATIKVQLWKEWDILSNLTILEETQMEREMNWVKDYLTQIQKAENQKLDK